MGNPEHIAILRAGVERWNNWRDENPLVTPDLSGEDLANRILILANLNNARFEKADLHTTDLGRSDLRGAILSKANLRGASLNGANLLRADLFQVDIQDASLAAADLRGANLRQANAQTAYLREANLRYASLQGADLRGSDIFAADFTGADLSGADLSRARLWSTTFGDNDLSSVIGLETVHHEGPSIIGTGTLFRSKGAIPEAFLRGAGVPDDLIVYLKALVGPVIESYSCFISYSSKDEDFAKRLHADLQRESVRCWFAPVDLKIGDKFRMRIDESIRINDKVMVILSANSIRSPWVKEEVEAALEKERKKKKQVLFPIRLDDAVMETDRAWAAELRRTRHIGDFREWKEHDSYLRALRRLVRDLGVSVVAMPGSGERDEI